MRRSGSESQRTPMIDGGSLWRMLESMGRIGGLPGGGCTRLAYSPEEDEAHDLLAEWAAECGLDARRDAVGNLFVARRADSENSRRPVLVGSHLDTVPSGGRYDGAYGVIAGLALLQAIEKAELSTGRPVQLVAFRNEEGTRFTPATMGSGYVAGTLTVEEVLASADRTNATVAAMLDRLPPAAGGDGPRPVPHAYLEAHIEQGPVLESEGKPVGAVTGVFAQISAEFSVRGREGHAGTTPMIGRRDALVGAARMIVDIRDLAAAERSAGSEPGSGNGAVATVGEIEAKPGARNAVPGGALFTLDIRAPALDRVERLYKEACLRAERISEEEGLDLSTRLLWSEHEVSFDHNCVEAVEAAAAELGIPNRRIISGAGHDAVNMARLCPAGMLFIPCRDGISHSPIEAIAPADAEAGAAVMLNAVLRLAR